MGCWLQCWKTGTLYSCISFDIIFQKSNLTRTCLPHHVVHLTESDINSMNLCLGSIISKPLPSNSLPDTGSLVWVVKFIFFSFAILETVFFPLLPSFLYPRWFPSSLLFCFYWFLFCHSFHYLVYFGSWLLLLFPVIPFSCSCFVFVVFSSLFHIPFCWLFVSSIHGHHFETFMWQERTSHRKNYHPFHKTWGFIEVRE